MVFGLVLYDLGARGLPGYAPESHPWVSWVAATVTTLVLFGSVVMHELSHSFVARRLGMPVSRITLFVFGGVAQVEEEPRKATDELLIALAGPAMSLVLAALFGGAHLLLAPHPPLRLLSVCCRQVALMNLVLMVFNMLPGFPLDGGRVLRSLLWQLWGNMLRATRVATFMGGVLGYGLAGLGIVVGLSTGNLWLGLFYGGMGLLLAGAARASCANESLRAMLADTDVATIVTSPQVCFPVDTTVGAAMPYLLNGRRHNAVAVVDCGCPVGVMSADRLRSVPVELWPTTTVQEVSEPLREEMVIRHTQSAGEALKQMEHNEQSELLVVDDWGQLMGFVDRSSVFALIIAES